jgi:tetratricopeptide (TPR) repeat protein
VPKDVRERIDHGQKKYTLGDFQEALRLFSEAYDLQPLPGILFNIAQCQRQLGNWERAGFFYRRYLSLSPARPKNAAEAETLLHEVEAKQHDQELAEKQRRDLEIARLNAAGAPVAAAPAPAMEPLPMPPMAAADPALTATAPAPEPHDGSVLKKWWFWTAVAVVVVGAGAVGVYADVSTRGHSAGSLNTINAQ